MGKPAIADEICYKLKQSLIVAPLKGKTSFKCKNWISLCIGTGTSTGTATMYMRRCMKINDNQNGGGVLFAARLHSHQKHLHCLRSWAHKPLEGGTFYLFFQLVFFFFLHHNFSLFYVIFLLFLGFCCNFKGNFILPFQMVFHYLKAQCRAIYCAWRSCCAISVCISFQNDSPAHLPLQTRRKNHNELQTK